MNSTLNDDFIPPTGLVVLNPIIRRSNALLRGRLGPVKQHLSIPFMWITHEHQTSQDLLQQAVYVAS